MDFYRLKWSAVGIFSLFLGPLFYRALCYVWQIIGIDVYEHREFWGGNVLTSMGLVAASVSFTAVMAILVLSAWNVMSGKKSRD